MSAFSSLNSIAEDDVKVVLGAEKQESTIDALNDSNVEAEIARDHLDEVEERNATAIELMQDVDVATESKDLTDKEYSLLAQSLYAITGRKTLKPPSMESDDKLNLRQYAMEGFKETLKKFWEFIKDSVKKFWNFLKRWYIKCFDISKRLKKRAEELIKKADGEYGSPGDNLISFNEATRLSVNGKFNEPGLIVKGFKDLEEIVFEFINETNSERFTDTVQELADHTEMMIGDVYKQSQSILAANTTDGYRVQRELIVLNQTDYKGLLKISDKVYASNDSDIVGLSLDKSGIQNIDKYKKLHGDEKDVFQHSIHLPGDKWVLAVQPTVPQIIANYSSISDVTEYLRRSKLLVTGCFYNDKKHDVKEVRALTPSLISRGCESIVKICEYIFDYRKSFEKRDKFKERIIKDIDNIVKDVVDDDETAFIEVDRSVRSFSNAIVGLIRRRSDFETSLCSYAVGVSVTFANYCDASLKNYS